MTWNGAYTQEMHDIEERTGKNIADFMDASCFPDCDDEEVYEFEEDYEDFYD